MNYKLCICVSGGLDSFAAYHYARLVYAPRVNLDMSRDVVLLQIVDVDSPYARKEMQIVERLYVGRQMFKSKLKTVRLEGYGQLAQTDDHVILGRNAVYASIAAAIAPEVWISGTRFENNAGMYDKNSIFWRSISKVLTRACSYKRIERTIIRSPFQGDLISDAYSYREAEELNYIFPYWEKYDMIKFLEDNDIYDWRNTVTCFDPVAHRCGACAVCGKRYVYEKYAELEYGIFFDTKEHLKLEWTFDKDPTKHNKVLLQTWRKMKYAKRNEDFSRYHKDRIRVYERVLGGESEEGKKGKR